MDKTFITQTVSTAVKYLGDKIDNLRSNPQKVELDLTSKAIEKLQEIDVREMNKLVSELQAVANGQAKSNSELIDTLKAFEKATKDDSRLVDVLKTSQNLQRQTLTAIEKMKKELKPEKDDKEYRALLSLEKAVNAIELQQEPFDLSPIKDLAKEVASLRSESTVHNKAIVAGLQKLYVCLKALPQQIKLEVPKTFKLDNEQLRSIRSGGGGMALGDGGDKQATNMTMANVAMTTANTEYSYTFPANTVAFDLKLRSQNTLLYYAWETGKLPVSGDAAAYATVPQNGFSSRDNIEWSGKTIYLETGSASQVAEIISYQL